MTSNRVMVQKVVISVVAILCIGACKSGSSTSINAVQPTLTVTATPQSVNSGQSSTLSWSSTNTESCTASGDWSGSRGTSGSESTGALSSTSSFTLSCSGPGGNVSQTQTVMVSASGGTSISGRVDSSRISRGDENRVYLFSGFVTPDDIDGDSGDPIASALVRQDLGSCTFAYDLGSLTSGDYTIAFTAQAANDDPLTDDAISFVGVQNLTLDATPLTADIEAGNILRVGPGQTYQSVAAAAGAASDGDVVEIDAGVYSQDVTAWYQNDLTLRGVGGYAHLRADGANSQGKAIWVIGGDNVVVENIEFSEITVPDQNGAGIRAEGSDLVVCNSYFHDSDEGILGGNGDVLIEYSEFGNNGFGDGQSHNIYILEGADRLVLRFNYIHHARIGHNVKSRAYENYILYNRIMDEVDGTASYAVDLPNGGLSFLVGNVIQQGANTDNSSIVNYGTEGLLGGRLHNLYLVNNTLVDDYGGQFVQAAGGTSLLRLINNLFVGVGNLVGGTSPVETTNLHTTAPGLVDMTNYNYRLTPGSAARDAGSAPGQGDGLDLGPVYQYVHPRGREDRPIDGSLDIGAYEYVP